MIIMGLDISTKSTGVSIFNDNKLLYHETAAAADSNVYNRIEKITKRI
jgi:RNase H-fold protein (predicted Holliday junction resolvase)